MDVATSLNPARKDNDGNKRGEPQGGNSLNADRSEFESLVMLIQRESDSNEISQLPTACQGDGAQLVQIMGQSGGRHATTCGNDNHIQTSSHEGDDGYWNPPLSDDKCVHCRICFMPFKASMMVLLSCNCLRSCPTCLKMYLESCIGDGFWEISCPVCHQPIPADIIEAVVDEEHYQTMKKRREERHVDLDPLRCWCPNPYCSKPCKRTKTIIKKVECKSCKLNFCFDCGQTWKPNHRILCKGESSALSIPPLRRESRCCPVCRARIIKEGGCNHVKCWNCKRDWCFLCLGPYTNDHYNSIGGCPGLMYSEFNLFGTNRAVRALTKTLALGGCLVAVVGVSAVGVAMLAVGGAVYMPYLITLEAYVAFSQFKIKKRRMDMTSIINPPDLKQP